jgi:hypothetical protein
MILDGTDAPWERWFAWYPVTIDACQPSEIRNENTGYKVWLRWVDRRIAPDGPPPHDFTHMEYRLP